MYATEQEKKSVLDQVKALAESAESAASQGQTAEAKAIWRQHDRKVLEYHRMCGLGRYSGRTIAEC